MEKPWNIESSQLWEFNGIKMGHSVTSYLTLNHKYQTRNEDDTVRLHMGLRGDYRFKYQNLNQSYDLIGGHHNLMYSQGIALEIENKSMEIETFGVNFPKAIFVDLLQDEDEELQTFCAQIVSGKSVMFSETWGSLTSPIQHVIDEIIHNPYQENPQPVPLGSPEFQGGPQPVPNDRVRPYPSGRLQILGNPLRLRLSEIQSHRWRDRQSCVFCHRFP